MQRPRCAGFLCAVFLLLSRPSLAAVIHVPGDYPTIQWAIDVAVAGDVVEVTCGTYAVHEIIMKSGVTLRSATGEPECVTVEPIFPTADPRRLLTCEGSDQTEIKGITFRNGKDSFSGAPIYFGQNPRVTRCRFTENFGQPSPLLKSIPEVPDMGGCDAYRAAIVFYAEATVTECEFVANFSAGGAVSVCGTTLFSDCLFADNYAEYAGGAGSSRFGHFVRCVFRNNYGYFHAGAVNAMQSTFEECVFDGNTAGIGGGAVSAANSIIDRCLFVDNSAGTLGYASNVGGGAIDVTFEWAAITGCTFVGNDASIPLMSSRGASAAYTAHGSAIRAGGLWMSVAGNIIVGSTGSEPVYCQNEFDLVIACSNIFDNIGGNWTGCIADQLGVNGNISADPVFCDPQNADFRLSSISPCLYADCGVMGAFGQGCFDVKPALFHVKDVGNDQGRQVRLIWQRSLNDSPAANPFVIGYGIYRKRDQFVKDTPLPEMARGEGVAIPGWDYLGTVPSRGDSLYETVVPTLCDSTITNGQCLSTFFVSAMTQNPFIYWDSPPHSGYSKDNLAPPTPSGFVVAYNTGDGNQLNWDAVAAGDFSGFNVYRSLPPGRAASAGELVATTTQTTWTDPDFDGWNVHYEVTSFDLAGNESSPAIAVTTTPVPSVIASRLELLPNIPNPFNPSTTIRFVTPEEGAVRIAIYDARGSLVRVLIDKMLPAGHYDAIWDGRDGKGSPVSSGVYLCRLEQRSDFRTRKIVLIK